MSLSNIIISQISIAQILQLHSETRSTFLLERKKERSLKLVSYEIKFRGKLLSRAVKCVFLRIILTTLCNSK